MSVRRGGDHELHAGPGLVLSGRQPQGPSLDGRALLLPISDPERAQPGPGGVPAPPELLLPGDFVQLRFDAPEFGHTPVVVEVGSPPALDRILVAAHSQDADLRPSKYYSFREIRGSIFWACALELISVLVQRTQR